MQPLRFPSPAPRFFWALDWLASQFGASALAEFAGPVGHRASLLGRWAALDLTEPSLGAAGMHSRTWQNFPYHGSPLDR